MIRPLLYRLFRRGMQACADPRGKRESVLAVLDHAVLRSAIAGDPSIASRGLDAAAELAVGDMPPPAQLREQLCDQFHPLLFAIRTRNHAQPED